MLQQFRQLDIDRVDMSEAVALYTFGRGLEVSYAEFGIEIPEWIGNRIKALKREIQLKNNDVLQRELAKAKMELQGLMTPAEQREEARKNIKRLEALLAN